MSGARVLKEHDSLVAALFAGRTARRLIPAARALGLSPTAVTMLSFATTLVAAALVAGRPFAGAGIVAAILVEVGFLLDCLDGQLARATGRASDFGRYVDSLTDLVKVFALVVALTASARAGGAGEGVFLLGAAAFFGYLLCEYHVQLVRQMPQRSQAEYETAAAPWKARLRIGEQKVDLAFAIGEVLATIALAAALDRPSAGLAVLAVATPVQYASYAVRFWRHRYRGPAAPA